MHHVTLFKGSHVAIYIHVPLCLRRIAHLSPPPPYDTQVIEQSPSLYSRIVCNRDGLSFV